MAGHDLEPAIAVRASLELTEKGIISNKLLLHDPCQAIQARQFGASANMAGLDEGFWLTCTVDRLLVPELHGLFEPHLQPSAYASFQVMECKASSGSMGDTLPEQYLYQVQHQLLVTGCEKAFLVSLAIDGLSRWDKLSRSQSITRFAQGKLRHWVIEPDPAIQDQILTEAQRLCMEVNSYRQTQDLPPLNVERWNDEKS